MTPTTTRTLSDFPPEVLAFAAEKGVTQYLPALCEFAQQTYPGCKFRVVLDIDPELCDVKTILFEVDIGDMEVEEAVARHSQWVRGLFERCPSTLVHAFGMDMVHDL